jgi:hypothetical protein
MADGVPNDRVTRLDEFSAYLGDCLLLTDFGNEKG